MLTLESTKIRSLHQLKDSLKILGGVRDPRVQVEATKEFQEENM